MPNERLPLPKLDGHPQTEEGWWDFLSARMEEIRASKEKYATWLETDALFKEQAVRYRADIDAREAQYLEEYKDEEAMLEIIKERVQALRDAQTAYEAAHERRRLAYEKEAEAMAELEESLAELQVDMRKSRN